MCYDIFMQKEAWSVSARFAWQKPWFRAFSILLVTVVSVVCGVFLTRVIPHVRGSTFVFHTNVYTGIDDIRSWVWVFAWPVVWLLACIGGVFTAYGVFRRDVMLAQAILVWLGVWSLPWGIALFYLLLVNTPAV